jgi:hypothetical protein
VARGRVTGTRAQHTERVIQALGDLVGRQQPAARSSQLDGQRQPIDAPADLRDRRRVGVVQVEVRVAGARSCAEQHDGIRAGQRVRVLGRRARGQRERRHGVALLGLKAERLAARRKDRERGTGIEQPADEACGRQHVLEVVDHHNRCLTARKRSAA